MPYRVIAVNGSNLRVSAGRRAALLSRGSLLALALASAHSTTAQAQSRASEPATIALDTIDVQGTKPTSTMGPPPTPFAGGQVARGGQFGLLGNREYIDTPFSATSFTETFIKDKQAQSVLDVVSNDPSVKPILGGGNYYESFLIRGMPVGVYDIAFQGLHGVAPASYISPQAYERIEIIKGPSILISGYPGTLGGIVDLVPKRAGTTPTTQITTFYGSDGNLGAHVDLGRRFGANAEWGVRVNGVLRDGATAIDHNKRQVGLATLGLDYASGPLRFSLDLGYQKDHTRGNRGGYSLLPGNLVPRAPSNSSNAFQKFEQADNTNTYGAARAEYDLTDSITLFGAFGGNNYLSDLTLSNPTLNAQGVTNAAFRRTDFQAKILTGEAGVRGTFQTGPIKHSWSIAGTSLLRRHLVGQGTAGSNISNIYAPRFIEEPLGTPTTRRVKLLDVHTNSVAIADTISILDERVQLTVGGRQQYIRQQFFGQLSSGERFSPAAGLVLKPTQNISLYANYLESLEPGSVAPATASNFGQSLPPAKTDSKEVGLKLDYRTIGATLALFELNRPSAATDPTSRVFGLLGEQRNRGIELTTFGEPIAGVRLQGGVTLLEPVLTKSINPAQIGNDAPGVTRAYATLGGEVDLPFVKGLTVSARSVMSGSSYVDAANLQKAGGWTRFDFGARYVFNRGDKPITIRADVLNAFDRRYWQTDSSTLVQGVPRTFLVSSTFDF